MRRAKEKSFLSILIIGVFIIGLTLIITTGFLHYMNTPESEMRFTTVRLNEIRALFSNNSAYDIVISEKNRPVFKKVDTAVKQANIDYKKGIEKLQHAYKLDALSKDTLDAYRSAIKMEDTGPYKLKKLTHEEQEQLNRFSEFMDIYENSYE